MKTQTTRRKLTLSALLIAGTAMLAGVGAQATFTDSATPGSDQTIDSGIVDINIGDDGTAANRLTVGASDIAAGDTIARAVDVYNDGSIDWSTMELDLTAPTTSLLDSGADGLDVTIEECTVAWTETALTAPEVGYTYTCSGTSTTIVTGADAVGNHVLDTALTSGDTAHLVITLDLPTAADNGYQNKTSVLDYNFTATQRDGMDK